MGADDIVAGLDADQREAVTIRASPLAIVAAAGSGKTTVLARRIAHRIVADDDVQAAHVLALTFTNQAARELQQRLRRTGVRDRVEAGTFHAVALRLLRQRALDAGQRPPSVTTDRMRLLNEALREAGSRDDPQLLLAELDWARARRISIEHYAASAQTAGRRPNINVSRLGDVANAFSTVKRRRGVVDFDDLLERLVQALTTDKMWGAGIRWRFRHLFVDEAQDLNPLQHALLEALRDNRPDICLVGDPRQAIFGFNGADPEIMNNVETMYPGVTIVRLRHNYRCSPQITDAGRRVLVRAGQTDDSIASSPDGPPVRVIEFGTDADESDGAGRLVREFVGARRPWGACAVLARTTNQLSLAARALGAMGIPTNIQGRSSRNDALAAALADAYAQRSTVDLGAWILEVGADEDIDPIRTRVAEAADRYLSQGTGMSFRSWVDLHSPFDDLEQPERVDAVDLMTFHGAKGREWPFVVVMGCETGLVPHSSAVTSDQRNEEARLLYVACTRASEQLVVTWAARRNDRAARASVLIDGLDAGSDGDAVAPIVPRPPRATPDPVYLALVEWRRNAARAADIDPGAICSDETLRAVAQLRPSTPAELAAMSDLGPLAAARIAPRMLAALNLALEDLARNARSTVGATGARTPPASSK